MKKVMLVLVLSVFAFGSSSFNTMESRAVDCSALAAAAWQSIIDQGGSYEYAAQVWSDTHWSCEQNQR